MKVYVYLLVLLISLFGTILASCTSTSKSPVMLTDAGSKPPSATITLTPINTAGPSLISTHPVASASNQITLPSVTLSPQDAEKAILELLKTNGFCTGKCVAGIRPDDMTVQDAIDQMAQWGMVKISQNSQGKTFINLIQTPLYGTVVVNLAVGTWTKELETIDRVSLKIKGSSELFLGENIWMANRDWQGVSLKKLLQTYGTPSFVGYFFETVVEVGSPLQGRTIRYRMNLQYEQTNIVVSIDALAFYDGEHVFLCPSKDPHNLVIEINPERGLKELQEFSPVIWQALTSMDLESFHKMFTDETDLDPCIKSDLQQIQSLQPSFR